MSTEKEPGAVKLKKERKSDPNTIQRRASDPAVSAWVTASAGTGKTKVLTDRILRLLLNGTDPADVLCITFTNAGAAVMKNRLNQELATWARCPQRELAQRLRKLTGNAPDQREMINARGLFAKALETPGGMKIQTIHSFSQSLLRRFPIESGVPPYFSVLDEREADEVLRQAEIDTLNKARDEPDSPLGMAVKVVTSRISDEEFQTLVSEITQERVALRKVFDAHGGMDRTIEEIFGYLGTSQSRPYYQALIAACDDENRDDDAPPVEDLRQAAEALTASNATDQARGAVLKEWLDSPAKERAAFFDEYLGVFFTQKGELRKKMLGGRGGGGGDICDIMTREANRLTTARENLNALSVAESTKALLILAQEIIETYTLYKKEKNQLDFDDLVYGASGFLSDRETTAWALEKIDGNLKHVLIDEAQDTNPEQWQLALNIAQEFFCEEKKGAPNDKTIFVVGDEKQSIYSFLRADLAVFNGMRDQIRKLVEKSGGKWREVHMDVSFRSTPAVLETVDAVFANSEAAAGLGLENHGDGTLKHRPHREGQSGSVGICPPESSVYVHSQGARESSWPLPLSIETLEEPAQRLAVKISEKIKGWLDSGEKLDARDRPIIPSDILVLVRRRSAFVDNLVRELKHRKIPVAGPDRMALWEQIGARDLVSLGQFLLAPDDDMNLAITLRSPVIGLDEKQLEEIALRRKGTLWHALQERAKGTGAETAPFRRAFEYLCVLIEKSRQMNPYNLYTDVLNSPCPTDSKKGGRGWSAIQKRLGTEVNDALVEFVAATESYERNHPPTLQGFLSWLEKGQADIRREINLESTEPKIHIMTVHGAKGLQAPIVILPDTMGLPSDNVKSRPRFLLPQGNRKVPIWIPRTDMENEMLRAERKKVEAARDDEYRRLLYVAMTRAEDRLEVFGYSSARAAPKGSWHTLIATGLGTKLAVKKPDSEVVELPDPGKPLVYKTEQTARPCKETGKTYKEKALMPVPLWATQTVKGASETVLRFTKDLQTPAEAANDDAPAPPVESLAQGPEVVTPAQARGLLVHRLLEFVPALAPRTRKAAIEHFVTSDDSTLSQQDRAAISVEIRNILENPELSFLFGENSQPEVQFESLMTLEKGQKVSRPGRIDRLVVTDTDVWIVDYKTTENPPHSEAEIKEDLLLQIASYRDAAREIFPGRKINCGFIWTRENRLQTVSDTALDAALQKKGLKIQPLKQGRKKSAATKIVPF